MLIDRALPVTGVNRRWKRSMKSGRVGRTEAARGKEIESCRARLDRAVQKCIAQMEWLPMYAIEERWRPEIVEEALKRKALAAPSAPLIQHHNGNGKLH